MKIDNELKIIISNRKVCYDWENDNLITSALTIKKFRKNGYIFADENGNNLGIVFKSDDKRTVREGSAEILFFKEYEQEHGVWRNIKIHGQYLPYSHLEEVLQKNGHYILTTDERLRKDR